MLLLGALLGNGQPHDPVSADDGRGELKRSEQQRVVGEHEVRASARPGLELALKRGFEVKLSKNVVGAQLVLRIAKARARAEEIAPGFVPVGPTAELTGADGDLDVSFVADQFRVRTGHQLTLAVERSGRCAGSEKCWQLVPAGYEKGRCVARAVHLEGGRLQFGSLPAP